MAKKLNARYNCKSKTQKQLEGLASRASPFRSGTKLLCDRDKSRHHGHTAAQKRFPRSSTQLQPHPQQAAAAINPYRSPPCGSAAQRHHGCCHRAGRRRTALHIAPGGRRRPHAQGPARRDGGFCAAVRQERLWQAELLLCVAEPRQGVAGPRHKNQGEPSPAQVRRTCSCRTWRPAL